MHEEAPLLTPANAFRAALLRISPAERDTWVDTQLGIDSIPDDGPELPRGCVPYLPCSVDIVLRMIEQAKIDANDVFVDIGSGLGRVALLVKMLAGARVMGIEVQPHLAKASRAIATRWNVDMQVVEGDADEGVPEATVYFLYCPFGGARFKRVLAHIEREAQKRPIRLCTVDLPVLEHDWLNVIFPISNDLVVYRSSRIEGDAEKTLVTP